MKNQDNDFNDYKILNANSITVNRNPNSINGLPNKNYVDDSVGEDSFFRFNQTLENFESFFWRICLKSNKIC